VLRKKWKKPVFGLCGGWFVVRLHEETAEEGAVAVLAVDTSGTPVVSLLPRLFRFADHFPKGYFKGLRANLCGYCRKFFQVGHLQVLVQ